MGKTRLALELVRHLGIDTLTLYAQNVPSKRLFWQVAADDSMEANVIIDECDHSEAQAFETLAHQCGGRLRLITVGIGLSTTPNIYRLSVLGQEAMERIIHAGTPTLPPDQVKWVAEKTQGYVKLAVVVAEAIARGAANIAQMSTDAEIRDVVSRLVLAHRGRPIGAQSHFSAYPRRL